MIYSKISGSKVDAWIWAPIEEVESSALVQIRNTASLPWAFHHIAEMPDLHMGYGCTVGTVVAMKDAVSPAAVGSDQGCGLGAMRLKLSANDLSDNTDYLLDLIESVIPVGFESRSRADDIAKKSSLWDEFDSLSEHVKGNKGKALAQCGTLGGGNHFIELCLDEDDRVWLMLHSGSRNIGKTIAEYHISLAKKMAHNADLPDKDLAVFLAGTPEFKAFKHDMRWAQKYAFLNRSTMLRNIQHVLKQVFPENLLEHDELILCHHNYISDEVHYGELVTITRKGAISAQLGELGVIPGSMGTCSYIVRGLGNPDSFCSASHGAGRVMSRGAAKRAFTLDDLIEQTKGVTCRKVRGAIDEAPKAYKKIETVMEHQTDLVEIVHTLKQFVCVKGVKDERR